MFVPAVGSAANSGTVICPVDYTAHQGDPMQIKLGITAAARSVARYSRPSIAPRQDGDERDDT